MNEGLITRRHPITITIYDSRTRHYTVLDSPVPPNPRRVPIALNQDAAHGLRGDARKWARSRGRTPLYSTSRRYASLTRAVSGECRRGARGASAGGPAAAVPDKREESPGRAPALSPLPQSRSMPVISSGVVFAIFLAPAARAGWRPDYSTT